MLWCQILLFQDVIIDPEVGGSCDDADAEYEHEECSDGGKTFSKSHDVIVIIWL